MKRIIFVIALFVSAHSLSAQQTTSDVFSGDDIVWYGLDFSNAKFVGLFDQAVGAGAASAYDLKTKHIPSWNTLILSEPSKYDIGKTFRKTNVYNDVRPVEKVNNKIDEDKMMTYNEFSFDNPEDVVKKSIRKYSGGDKSQGLGVVFIIESFHKDRQEAALYVTFFDIATKNLIFTERLIGKAKGIGLRNYWGGAIFNVLIQIQKTEFNAWKRKYSN